MDFCDWSQWYHTFFRYKGTPCVDLFPSNDWMHPQKWSQVLCYTLYTIFWAGRVSSLWHTTYMHPWTHKTRPRTTKRGRRWPPNFFIGPSASTAYEVSARSGIHRQLLELSNMLFFTLWLEPSFSPLHRDLFSFLWPLFFSPKSSLHLSVLFSSSWSLSFFAISLLFFCVISLLLPKLFSALLLFSSGLVSLLERNFAHQYVPLVLQWLNSTGARSSFLDARASYGIVSAEFVFSTLTRTVPIQFLFSLRPSLLFVFHGVPLLHFPAMLFVLGFIWLCYNCGVIEIHLGNWLIHLTVFL